MTRNKNKTGRDIWFNCAIKKILKDWWFADVMMLDDDAIVLDDDVIVLDDDAMVLDDDVMVLDGVVMMLDDDVMCGGGWHMVVLK